MLAPADPTRRGRALVDRRCCRRVDRVLGPPRSRRSRTRRRRRGRSSSRLPAAFVARSLASGRCRAYRRRAALVTARALVPLVALGWWAVHPAAVLVAASRACASRSSTSGRGTASCSRRRRARCSSTQGPPEARVDRQLRRLGLHSLAAIVLTHRAPRPRRRRAGRPSPLARRAGDRPDAAGRRASTSGECAGPPAGSACRSCRRAWGRTYALGRLRLRVLWPDHAGSPRRGSASPRHRPARELRLDRPAADRRFRVGRYPVAAAAAGRGAQGRPSRLVRRRPRRRAPRAPAAGRRDLGRRAQRLRPPAAPTRSPLSAADPASRVYRTDENGRIVLESDGRSLTVRTERAGVR